MAEFFLKLLNSPRGIQNKLVFFNLKKVDFTEHFIFVKLCMYARLKLLIYIDDGEFWQIVAVSNIEISN